MMREYASQKSIKHQNTPYSYVESMKSKYSGLRQKSPIDVSRDRYSRLKNDTWRDKVAELSRQKNRYQQVHREHPNSQMNTNKLQSPYQSLFDKKIGVNEQSSATITDRIHLRLKDMNKNYSDISSLAARNILTNRVAIKQINGSIRDNKHQSTQLQQQPISSRFDSPIKLLYCEGSNYTQLEQAKPILQQKKEVNILVKSKNSIKASQTNIPYKSYQNINLERENSKNVISNVEQILAQIRKTLSK